MGVETRDLTAIANLCNLRIYTFCISSSAARFRDALQSFQPMIMGEVDVLRVSTSRKARCHTGSRLLESHHALF